MRLRSANDFNDETLVMQRSGDFQGRWLDDRDGISPFDGRNGAGIWSVATRKGPSVKANPNEPVSLRIATNGYCSRPRSQPDALIAASGWLPLPVWGTPASRSS